MSYLYSEEFDYPCGICGDKALEGYYEDSEEFDLETGLYKEECVRVECNCCGYVHVGASDPWELERNDEIENEILNRPAPGSIKR